MLQIYYAMQNKPFIYKTLTVTGAVREPCVLQVPIGTSFANCLTAAGSTNEQDYIVVSGGPMMGQSYTAEQARTLYVSKTTSGFLVLPNRAKLWGNAQKPVAHTLNQAASACIQCSFCTQLCPRYLLGHPIEPHKVMRMCGNGSLKNMLLHGEINAELLENEALRNAAYCSECGVCDFIACPMGLQPRKVNQLVKATLRKAGIRPQKGETNLEVRAFREDRQIPTQKAARAAGVGTYYHTEPIKELELHPKEVCIALNSHIGAPAKPCVELGQSVTLGQLIAKCPDGALGVDYHASLAGKVTGVGDFVRLTSDGV
jgi:Na+-translocating ferredoxin:NAD+ oxidoreductase RnfC subunit